MTGEPEEVLSQTPNEPQGTPPEKVQEKTPEQKEHDRVMFERRKSMKNWKQNAEASSKKARDEAVARVAKEEGFDSEDEENKKQLRFVSKTYAAARDAEIQSDRQTKSHAASEFLTESFRQLEIDPTSQEALVLGNSLFKKYGVDDPEKFSDPKMIEEEMESLAARLTRKKPDSIKEEAMRKSGAPKGASESRAGDSNVRNKAENKDLSKRWGVSEGNAEKIKKLRDEAEKSIWSR